MWHITDCALHTRIKKVHHSHLHFSTHQKLEGLYAAGMQLKWSSSHWKYPLHLVLYVHTWRLLGVSSSSHPTGILNWSKWKTETETSCSATCTCTHTKAQKIHLRYCQYLYHFFCRYSKQWVLWRKFQWATHTYHQLPIQNVPHQQAPHSQ